MYYGEKLNSISHLVGAVLALVGLGSLLTVGVQSGDPWILVSFAVFGLTMVLLFTVSTLYHSFHPPALKKLFQLFDHVAIYLLIAGTYTPFMLVSLRHGPGMQVMLFVWGLAAVGILSEVFLSGRAVKVGQMVIYLGMGWAISYDMDGLRAAISAPAFYWLLAGGLTPDNVAEAIRLMHKYDAITDTIDVKLGMHSCTAIAHRPAEGRGDQLK